MNNMQQASNEELLKTGASTEDGQAPNVSEEDNKNLQAFATKARQGQIDLAIRLAKADKKAILDLDEDLQNKVIKQVYWLNNLEEVKLIHGDDFYVEKNHDDEDNDNRSSKLEQEVKLMRYQIEKKSIDDQIEVFKASNKLLFDNDNAEKKLRDELKYISSDLPVEERIKKAARAAFWAISTNDNLYVKLMETQWLSISSPSSSAKKEVVDTSIADSVLARARINKRF